MKPYSSTYLKTHFGAVMDRESLEPVRIERRGRKPAVLIPESEYQELQGNALSGERDSESALARLHSTALGPEADFGTLESDPRARAVLRKRS